MTRIELITLTGCGTRSVAEHFLKDFGANNGEDVSYTFSYNHFSPDRKHIDRLLVQPNTIILSTWRDPLRTTVHNLYKGRNHILQMFEQLQELRQKKTVLMLDLRCVPFSAGAGEVSDQSQYMNDGGALRKAYFNKDITRIEGTIPKTLAWLREHDWGDLWTEEWWR